MADRIIANTERLRELATLMRTLAGELGSMGSQVRGVQIAPVSGADVGISTPIGMLQSIGRASYSGSAESCLRSLAACLEDMEQYADRMVGRINDVADEFEYTEKSLTNLFEGQYAGETLYQSASQAGADGALPSYILEMFDTSFLEKAQVVIGGDIIGVMAPGVCYLFDQAGLLGTYKQKSGWTGTTETCSMQIGSSRVEAEREGGLLTFGGKLEFDSIEKTPIGDEIMAFKDGKEISDYQKRKGDPLQMLTIGASTGMSVSAIGGENNWITDNQSAHVSAGLLNAEATAQVAGGLGVYLPDENGNNQLYLGVGAEAGVSISAAQAEASYEYELCDWVEVGVEGDVKVLSAGANVGAGIGIIGNELVGYVEASAEANLIEASVEGSVNVAGVAGTIGASVTVGVGAHAKIGLDDGVLVVDVGASLGVGASVNIELDISEVIENVGDAVGSFVGGVASFCGWW